MRKDKILCIFCQSSATQLIIPTRKRICWVWSWDFLLRKRNAFWEWNWELQFIFILTMRKQAWLSLVVDLCCSWITDPKVSAIYIKHYSHKLSCIEWENHILLFIKKSLHEQNSGNINHNCVNAYPQQGKCTVLSDSSHLCCSGRGGLPLNRAWN